MRVKEYLIEIRDLIIATVCNISFQHRSLTCLLLLLITATVTVCGDRALMPGLNSSDFTAEQTTAAMDMNDSSIAAAPDDQQKIITPNSVQTTTYTVKSGDTLWDIAVSCKTSVEQLMAINNLQGEKLSIGQQLIVAGTAPAPQNRSTQVASRSGQSAQTPPTTSVVKKAAQYLNTPYVWGGERPGGFDCSGFVKYVFAQCGYKLPRTAAEQASVGTKVTRKNLAPGDLVYFATGGGGINHIGIYVGNNKFIHSSSPRSGGVIYTSLSDSYYANSYAGATRVTK